MTIPQYNGPVFLILGAVAYILVARGKMGGYSTGILLSVATYFITVTVYFTNIYILEGRVFVLEQAVVILAIFALAVGTFFYPMYSVFTGEK